MVGASPALKPEPLEPEPDPNPLRRSLSATIESYAATIDRMSKEGPPEPQPSATMSYVLMMSYCGVCALSLAGGAIAGSRAFESSTAIEALDKLPKATAASEAQAMKYAVRAFGLGTAVSIAACARTTPAVVLWIAVPTRFLTHGLAHPMALTSLVAAVRGHCGRWHRLCAPGASDPHRGGRGGDGSPLSFTSRSFPAHQRRSCRECWEADGKRCARRGGVGARSFSPLGRCTGAAVDEL